MESVVSEALRELTPSLEEHFRVELSGFESPVFLRYGAGAFYRPHKDGHPGAPSCTQDRRVSVVIFLNGQSEKPSPDTFGGGALTFYGIMEGPQWQKCAFALDPEPGLLIAFRSELLHEVRPVTFGHRFSVVSWYRA
jgi:SM-20-related protein